MAVLIPCDQFVYSKFTGADRSSSYTPIAKSSKISDAEIKEIRNLFNGCRPGATDLSSYHTSYAVVPFADKLVLLRLDVITDLESGNKYILYERYLVLEKKDIKKETCNPWQVLSLIPPPKAIQGNVLSLPSSFNITVKDFSERLKFVYEKLLASNTECLISSFSALFYLLNSKQIKVSDTENLTNRWDWLLSLDMITPISLTSNLRLFVGSLKPKDWVADVFVTYASPKDNQNMKVTITSTNNSPENIYDLEKRDFGYSNFLRRCAEQDFNLFEKLLYWADNLDFQTTPVSKVTKDVLLKTQIPSEIRLDLARMEVDSETPSLDDLYWLWRNGELTFGDIQKFLPLLISQILDKWSEKDFDILSSYIDSFSPKAIAKLVSHDEVFYQPCNKLLINWSRKTDKLKPDDISFWVEILLYLVKEKNVKDFDAFICFLKFVDLTEYKSVKRVLEGIPQKTTTPSSVFWELIFWMCSHIKAKSDLETCRNILSSADSFKEKKFFLIFFDYLLQKDVSRDKGQIALQQIISEAKDAQILNSLIPHLINLVLLSNNLKALLLLFFYTKDIQNRLVYKHKIELFKHNDGIALKYSEIIISSKNEEYISAYIFLLAKIYNQDKVQEIVTRVLLLDIDLFEKVIKYCLSHSQLDAKVFLPSFATLKKHSEDEQLNVLIQHFVVIFQNGLNEMTASLNRIDKILMNIESLQTVDSAYLGEFLMLMQKNERWLILRRILEHKVRFAILNKNAEDIERALSELLKVITLSYKISTFDRTRQKIVLSYLKASPDSAKKDLSDWLLVKPLSSSPPLIKIKSQPLTSNLITNRDGWFTANPFIRYCLFEELSKW